MSIHKDKFLAINSAFTNESTSIVVATAQHLNQMIQSKIAKQVDRAEKDLKKSRKLLSHWSEGK